MFVWGVQGGVLSLFKPGSAPVYFFPFYSNESIFLIAVGKSADWTWRWVRRRTDLRSIKQRTGWNSHLSKQKRNIYYLNIEV